ncbi:MAG: hypothetical protein HY514_01795 [Candidatus Aenigmarchaeota archaeon]|nr:hypothetical protein [Candidatus Aenigmarchaeota archaeon]
MGRKCKNRQTFHVKIYKKLCTMDGVPNGCEARATAARESGWMETTNSSKEGALTAVYAGIFKVDKRTIVDIERTCLGAYVLNDAEYAATQRLVQQVRETVERSLRHEYAR